MKMARQVKKKKQVMDHIGKTYDCYEIGEVKKGEQKISFRNRLNWL